MLEYVLPPCHSIVIFVHNLSSFIDLEWDSIRNIFHSSQLQYKQRLLEFQMHYSVQYHLSLFLFP